MSANPEDNETHPPVPSSISTLPEEIVDIIFDLIRHSDVQKRTLFACRQVSRAWGRIALRHCFHSLDLRYRFQGEVPLVAYYIQDFVLDGLFETVRHCVRSLTLTSGTSSEAGALGVDAFGYVALLPAVRTLTLSGLFSERIPRTIFNALGHTPSVSTLTLTDTNHYRHCQTFDAICDILCLFSEVHDLRLDLELEQLLPYEREWERWQSLPRLTSLTLVTVKTPAAAMHALSRRTHLFDTLVEINMLGYASRHMGLFVNSLAARLEHVQYSIDPLYQLGGTGDPLEGQLTSLAAFGALRSVSIEVKWNWYNDSHMEWSWGKVKDTLSSIDHDVHLDIFFLRIVDQHAAHRGPGAYPRSLRKLPAQVVDLDATLASMVVAGRLLRVCTGLYTRRGAGIPRHSSLQYVPDMWRIAFPQVYRLGALRVLDEDDLV